MRFSLTYQRYRLLDIKALTEYHLNCLANSDTELAKILSSKASDQDSGQKPSEVGAGTVDLKIFCETMFHVLDHSTLRAFEMLCNTVLYGKENTDTMNSGNHFIDLADYRHFFEKFATVDEDKLETLSYSLNEIYEDCMQETFRDEGYCYTQNLRDLRRFLQDNDCAKALDNYLIEHIMDSYKKIWFGRDTVLTIYAQAPIVTNYVMNAIRHECKRINVSVSDPTFGAIEQDYFEQISSLTFNEYNNKTTVYRLYIGSYLSRTNFYSRMGSKLQNNRSVLLSKDGDGKAVAICEQTDSHPQFKASTTESPKLDPGVLLAKIKEIDDTMVKKAARKKKAVSIFLSDTGFSFNSIEECKYLIQNKYREAGTAIDNITWVFSGTYRIREPLLPLQHMLASLLRPEFEAKQIKLKAIWKSCGHRDDLKFEVNLPDSAYIFSAADDADSGSGSKPKSFMEYAVSTIAKNTHITDDLLKTVIDFYGGSGDEDHINMSNSAKLIEYDTFRCVINEAWLLDAYLRTKEESLAKLWYEYLSSNFFRDDIHTKLMMNAYNFIVDSRSRRISGSSVNKDERYPANAFIVAARDDFQKALEDPQGDFQEVPKDQLDSIKKIRLHTITTTSLGNIVGELSRAADNKTTTFALLRKSAAEAAHNVNPEVLIKQSKQSSGLGALHDPTKILTDFVQRVKKIFYKADYYMLDLNIKETLTKASEFIVSIMKDIDRSVSPEETATEIIRRADANNLTTLAYSLLYTLPLDYQVFLNLPKYTALAGSLENCSKLVSVLLTAITDVESAYSKLEYVKNRINSHIDLLDKCQLFDALFSSAKEFVTYVNSIFGKQTEFSGFDESQQGIEQQTVANDSYVLILAANKMRTQYDVIKDAISRLGKSDASSSSDNGLNLENLDITAIVEQVLTNNMDDIKLNDDQNVNIFNEISDAIAKNSDVGVKDAQHSAIVWLIVSLAKFHESIATADFDVLMGLVADRLYLHKDYRGYSEKKSNPLSNDVTQGLYDSIKHIISDSAYRAESAYLQASQISRSNPTEGIYLLTGYIDRQNDIQEDFLQFICNENNEPLGVKHGDFIYYLHYTGLYIRTYSTDQQPLCLTADRIEELC